MPFVKNQHRREHGGKKAAGSAILPRTAGTTIVLSVFDFVSDDKRAFDIGLASLLTFRKK